MLVWMFVWLAAAQDENPFAVGESLMRQGEYFVAEGHFLSLEPDQSQVVPLGKALAEIALRLGGSQSKQPFYKSLFLKSKDWRSTALLTLSCLAAHERDWPEFQTNARLLLQEFEFDDPLKYRMLFHLARYTDQDEAELGLTPVETAWFRACRATPKDRLFPEAALAGLPYYLREARRFETGFGPVPDPGPGASQRDRYYYLMFQIKQALTQGDDNAAATAINQLAPLDREWSDPALQTLYFSLLQEFYQLRNRPNLARIVAGNRSVAASWALLPFQLLPDHVREPERIEPPTVEPADAEPEPEPEPVEPEPAKPEPADRPDPERPLTFEALEKMAVAKQKGLELTIKAKTADTSFKKIYKNYLLGVHYLNAGRLDRAFERLELASRLAADYPFPNLECKIFLALGDYYERRAGSVEDSQARAENLQQANWHRIEAVQLWNAPEHIPVFVNQGDLYQRSPYGPLIDQALRDVSNTDSISQLLFYSELAHYSGLLRRAFKRRALSANTLLDNQFQQIGGQLHQLVRSLAENPQTESTPRRYNDALDLWNRLWAQTMPYYRDDSAPSVSQIQGALTGSARALSFIEGESLLGVLVIAKTQAFAVSLGAKSNYLGLSPQGQFDFLEGRLGPIWSQGGALILDVSDVFRRGAFVKRFKDRMSRPDRLTVVYSLKSYMSKKTRGACRNYAVFSETRSAEIVNVVRSLPQPGLAWRSGSELNPQALADGLERCDHAIFIGAVRLTVDGLKLGEDEDAFPVHEIYHQNPRLCSLTLVSPGFDEWGEALNELELIDPSSSMYIRLLENLSDLDPAEDLQSKNGLVFPR